MDTEYYNQNERKCQVYTSDKNFLNAQNATEY